MDPGRSWRVSRKTNPLLATPSQPGWSSPTPPGLQRPHLADFATFMGRKPLAGLRSRRLSRPGADRNNESANTSSLEEDPASRSPERPADRRPRKQRLAALSKRRESATGPDEDGTSSALSHRRGLDWGQSLEVMSRDEETDDNDSFDKYVAPSERQLEGDDEGHEEIVFQNISYESEDLQHGDAALEEDDEVYEEDLTDVSDTEPDREALLLLQLDPREEIAPGVLRHFGDLIDDLELEDLEHDSQHEQGDSDRLPVGNNSSDIEGLPSASVSVTRNGIAEASLDEAVEEIISKIRARSLLADLQQKQEEPTPLADFAAFNWKPNVDFFQFDGRESSRPPGQVFTFEKAALQLPSSPAAKKRPLQKQGRVKNGPRYRHASLARINRT